MYLKWNEIITVGSFVVGIMARKKVKQKWISWACWVVFGISAFVLIYNIARPDRSKTESGQKALTEGDNSPAVNFAANTSGSNSPVTQTFINNSYPSNEVKTVIAKEDEILSIVRYMQEVKGDNDAELLAKFQLGYILFSVTQRKEIVPLNSAMDNILKIDWKSGYEVSFSETHVHLRLPDMAIFPPEDRSLQ
jgi:hypothetical protein